MSGEITLKWKVQLLQKLSRRLLHEYDRSATWPETHFQTNLPSQGVPFRHWMALGTCARYHPPAGAFLLGPEHGSLLLTPFIFLYSLSKALSSVLSSPLSCLLSPLQPVSLSLSLISPSVLPPPQEWGKSSTLSKTLQTSCPPHSVHWIKGKEEGTLNQQWGWGLLYGAKEVRCRGGIWMECEGDCTSLLSDSWQKRARE